MYLVHMQQSDYILREIEKIGAMLLGMIGKMIRRKKEGIELNEDEYSELNKEILEDANFDIEAFVKLDKSGFDTYFREKNGFNDKNIEILADLLVAIADINFDEERKKQLFSKALELYYYLDKSSKILSFDRMSKIENLCAKMEEL